MYSVWRRFYFVLVMMNKAMGEGMKELLMRGIMNGNDNKVQRRWENITTLAVFVCACLEVLLPSNQRVCHQDNIRLKVKRTASTGDTAKSDSDASAHQHFRRWNAYTFFHAHSLSPSPYLLLWLIVLSFLYSKPCYRFTQFDLYFT